MSAEVAQSFSSVSDLHLATTSIQVCIVLVHEAHMANCKFLNIQVAQVLRELVKDFYSVISNVHNVA